VGVGAPKKDFHSFRHTVATKLKNAEVSEPVAAALLGHSSKGITYNRYGKQFEVAKLVDALNKVTY
jgi:integrase